MAVSDETDTPEVSFRQKLHALYEVASYRLQFTTGIILLSILTAMLEGIDPSFLILVIEIAQEETNPGNVSDVGQVFISAFEFVGVLFTLEWVIVSVALVMVVRYTASFLVAWLRAALRTHYIRYLQMEGFENALNAWIAYYDEQSSDEILNAIVT